MAGSAAPAQDRRHRTRGAAGSWLRDVLALVLPVECVGCGAHDVHVCRDCLAPLLEAPRRCEEDTVYLAPREHPPSLGLPTWALAPYASTTRSFVLAWKTGVRPDLARYVTAVGVRLGAALAGELAGVAHASREAPLLVVPAPSGWRRRLARRFVVGALADAVGAGLAQHRGGEVWVVDVLRRSGGSSHALGAAARGLAGRARVRTVTDPPAGARCVLVDDVVTTGATLAAARAALEASGVQVVAAVALAATPRPGTGTWRRP